MNLSSCRSLVAWVIALPLQAAPLPQLALPVRELPPDVQQYASILCGDLCLVRSSASGEEVSKTYRSVDNGWQVIENHLPFIEWPTKSRDGLLAYRFWKEQGTVSCIVDANSGQLLWEDLSPGGWEDFSAGYHVAFHSGNLTIHDRFGGSVTHACPAVGSPYASRIAGNEIVYLYNAGGGVQVRRQDLITGGILDSWTLTSSARLAGFHAGKVLLVAAASPTGIGLLRAGTAGLLPVPTPSAHLPGGSPIYLNSYSFGGLISATPDGAWVATSSNLALHFDLGADPVACDRVALPGTILSVDGSRLAGRASGQPAYVYDGSPDAPPVIRFGAARGTELSGQVPVTLLLDRPASTPISVRIASRTGGTAGPADYQPLDEWITIGAGETEGVALLRVTPDLIPEIHETVRLEVIGSVGAAFLPGTSTVAVIEASGVSRRFVGNAPPIHQWPFGAPKTLTGGDGLLYRIVDAASRVPRLEVVDPSTSAVLETLHISGFRPGAVSTYQREPYLEATAGGVRCHVREPFGNHFWEFSASRSHSAVEVKINPPTEGGIPGHLEFRLREGDATAREAAWSWSVLNKANGYPGARKEPVDQPTGSIPVPADGSPAIVTVMARSRNATDRAMPLCLTVSDASGDVTEIALVECGSGHFRPVRGTPISGDPSLAPGYRIGGSFRLGDEVFLGNASGKDLSGNPRPCIEVFDATSGAFVRSLPVPGNLSHGGFAESISGDERDLFVLSAEEPDLPKVNAKIRAKYRTLHVISPVTGAVRATLKGPYAGFGETVRFNDEYLALCAESSVDPVIKGFSAPGGVMVYRRTDYKRVGSYKFKGNFIGTSMEIVGNVLFLGVPAQNFIYKKPGERRGDLWEYVGAVYAFPSLPSLKRPVAVLSPTGPRHGTLFGHHMAVDRETGDLLASERDDYGSERDHYHRIDPTGSRAPMVETGAEEFFPVIGYQESGGSRFSHGRVFDRESRIPLVDLNWMVGALVGNGVLFAVDGAAPIRNQIIPLHFCGNFDLWAKSGDGGAVDNGDPSRDGNGNGSPDIEDYIVAQTGSLPQLQVAFDPFHFEFEKVRFRVDGSLPPDAVMVVETRRYGGPWRISALLRGGGPMLDQNGIKVDASGWTTPQADAVLPEALEVRVNFLHSQATAMGQDEFRVVTDP